VARVSFNDAELNALKGLPLAARVVYMEGIRPFMDYVTGIVGARDSRSKRISHQSLSEVLYVEPKPNRKGSGSPTRKQVRQAVNQLVDAGVVTVHSTHGTGNNHLILKCVLADTDESLQNKLGIDWAKEPGINGAEELGRGQESPKPNNNNDLSGSDKPELGKGDKPELGKGDKPELGTPPDTVLKDNTTHAPARKAGLIPDDFHIDTAVQLRLQTGGVRLVVAEYFIQEFKAEAESRGSVSFNWPAELVKYCKRWEWRYDKEQPNATGVSGNKSNSSSRASRVHQSLKDEYARAIAEEQGNQTVQPVSGEVRSQVVVPYRRRGTETSGDS